jgi:hypothetical protein
MARPSVCALALAAAIVGGATAAHAAVTSVTITPASLTGQIACPPQQIFIGQVTSNRAGDVEIRWTTSDGQSSPVQHVPFEAPGAKPVSYLWLATAPGPAFHGWVRLDTRRPNRRHATAEVSAVCGPSAHPDRR